MKPFKTPTLAFVQELEDHRFIFSYGTTQFYEKGIRAKKILKLLRYTMHEKKEQEINNFLESHNIERNIFNQLLSLNLITSNVHLMFPHDNMNYKNELYLASLYENEDKIMKRIKESTFIIIGAGGIGNYMSFALNSFLPKEIVLVDADIIEVGNLNRQFLFSHMDIGKYKVDVLKEQLTARNNGLTTVRTIKKYIQKETIHKLLNTIDNNSTLIILSGDSNGIVETVSQYCSYYSIPFLNIGYLNDISIIGPFYIPEISSCPLCHSNVLPKTKKLNNIVQKINDHYSAPSSFVNNSFASAMAISDVISYFSQKYEDIVSLNRRVGIENKTFNKLMIDVDIDPNCEYCGVNNEK